MIIETKRRTVTRVIVYRIIALLITALWTGLSDAIAIHIVLMAVHYVLERIWLRIHWGRHDTTG